MQLSFEPLSLFYQKALSIQRYTYEWVLLYVRKHFRKHPFVESFAHVPWRLYSFAVIWFSFLYICLYFCFHSVFIHIAVWWLSFKLKSYIHTNIHTTYIYKRACVLHACFYTNILIGSAVAVKSLVGNYCKTNGFITITTCVTLFVFSQHIATEDNSFVNLTVVYL